MHKGRLEAFSDGVLAIIITIMVLELKVPHEGDLHALKPLLPIFISYILSFIYVGIYWNNHHHMLQAADKVNGAVLWANLHLLFWLSLIPATTAWMGEHEFALWPVILYGCNLLLCGAAFTLLTRVLVRLHGNESVLGRAIAGDSKGKLSVALYLAAIGLAFVHPFFSYAVYIGVAVLWLVPDSRIEKHVEKAR